MVRKAGISLANLLDLTDRINSALPQTIQDFVERFSVIDHRAIRSPGAIIHHGRLQSISDAFDSDSSELDIGIGTLALPLIHGGLPFQLSMQRAAITGNLEPGADAWQLNLFLADFILTLDGLKPAIYVPETGATPRHLLRDNQNSKVRIIGSAVLRLQKSAGVSDVDVVFVDQPDPLDPTLLSGGVAQLTFSPPHFFFGTSDFGMSVGQLQFDFSKSYSPPHVLEQNQGPSWVGLAIREATVYAPRNLPVIGDLSGGVRDVLLGRPMGVQGEFELQFGRTALDPTTFQFKQDLSGPDLPMSSGGSAPTGEQPSRTVTIEGGQDEDITINAGFTAPAPPTDGSLPTGSLQNWTARWTWRGQPTEEADSSTGTVRHGHSLAVEPIEIVTVSGVETRFNHPPITFRFVAAGEAPLVSATAGTERFENVVHLGGTTADIASLTLTATSTAPGSSTFTWEIASNNISETGNTFSPDLTGLTGQHFIVLKEMAEGENTNRLTRIRVRIIEEGSLLIGTEGGVFDAGDDTTPLDLSAVEATYDLSDFHGDGALNSKREQARINPATAPNVSVPDDGLALVTISDAVPPSVLHDRHIQILMLFEEDIVTRWGDLKPVSGGAAANETDLQIQLLEWASHYPGAEFLVIGRCDDIGEDVPGESPDPFNIRLAKNRAAKGRSLLTSLLPSSTGSVIDNTRIFTRGETSDWDTGSNPGNALEESADIALTPDNPQGISAAGKSEARSDLALSEGWLIKHEQTPHTGWVNKWDTSQTFESTREKYRRVDIYAVGGTPTAAAIRHTGEPERAPTLRRSMVPAADRTPAPVEPAASNIDYRVKLLIKWDSPTATEWKDAIPTKAEAEFAWTPQELPLPQANGQDVGVSREVLTVYAKWVHDARTGFTRTTLGIRSDGDPDGLISTDQKNLTAALAFGPMLLSGVDLENDVIGSGARISALIAAAAFADVPLGGSEPLVGDDSKTALIAVEAEAQTRSIAAPGDDYQIKLTTEYVTTIHVNGGVLGIRTADDRPVKIRYKDVGFEFDNSKAGWEKIGLAFDTSSMEIEDSGQWMIDGVLGELLRIVEIAFGRGSLWIEGRIAIAISIGVVEISEAIIRLTFKDGSPLPKFELRGFVLKADIPNILEGEGRLRIEDGGLIRAGVDASIIPLGLGANAAIAIGKPPEIDPDVFLSLFLGVQFSTPLPLAQSGAAIYGFKGLFTMNGSRKLPANPDPIARELNWWATPPENKYKPDRGQYAIGVGVVVGTMPDVSFCFSASGMVVVAFPDPEVILGVDVKVIEVPNTTVSDEGSPEGTITGLIVIDDTAVKVAVSAQYEIPKVLKLKVPFGAYFPYSGNGVYVRLGSDGETEHGRFGEPITITLLPGTLDVQAWSYLMIEQDGLPSLGGLDEFSFDGFAVGFGAGWGIHWSAGPIKLSASAKVLVGFGTKPLLIKGGVFVAGELDLVVLSISARGELILTYLDENIFLEGEFCGEVDLFFFSIKGCVGVKIGGTGTFEPPAPEPPVVSISLTDRKDRIMGAAALITDAIAAKAIFEISEDGNNDGASPNDNNTVWPDTAPVLHFSHYIANALPVGSQFDIAPNPSSTPTPTQPIWFGSNRLKYTYRLDNIILRRKRDNALVTGDDVLQSVWMATPYRQPDSSGTDNPIPSEHEGPNLKLLDWNPWNWVVNMDDGAESTDGDPAEEAENLCDPLPQPNPACVFGRAARGAGWYSVRLRQETPAPPPYPSRFYVTGEPAIRAGGNRIVQRDLQTLITSFGGSVIPGQITSLAFPVPHGVEMLKKGYLLPFFRRAVVGGMQIFSLPWEGRFDREVTRPTVTLMVCDAEGQVGEGKKDCTEFKGVRPDGKHTSLAHLDLVVRALNQQQPFTLRDIVDTHPVPDQPGQDGNADISFPSTGIEIFFRKPCTQVELHFMGFTNADIQLKAENPSGVVVATKIVTGPQSRPLVGHLNSPDGIAHVIITGGGNEAVLYRICCISPDTVQPTPDPKPDSDCVDFRNVKPNRRPVKKFEHEGFHFVPLKRGGTLLLVDTVDISGRVPVSGSDRSAEILFPSSGMEITLKQDCEAVELWVMLFNSDPVTAVALNARGKEIAQAASPRSPRKAHRLILRPRGNGGIARIIIKGGGNKSVVFRICCLGEKAPATECVTFAGLRPIDNGVTTFTHAGIIFTDLSSNDRLQLKDAVDDQSDPAAPGRDNVLDLQFADEGLRIAMPRPCEEITVHVMLFAGSVKGVSLNSLGARTDRSEAGPEQGVEHVLTFKGPDITIVELFGGSEKGVVFKICCSVASDATDTVSFEDVLNQPLTHAAAAHVPDRTPVVRGIVDTDLADTWPGKVLHTHLAEGRTCRVIEYQPARGLRGPWNGFQIITPQGKMITLLSVCGIDQSMADRRNEDQAARDDRRDEIVTAGVAAVNERREVLLEAGEDYEIEIEWSWQAWQSNEDATDSPPATPPGVGWKPGINQIFQFSIAEEKTDTGNTQDGLNEYVFDARDVNRHLYRLEPADGREVHFTDDPLWAHFDAGHMQQLLEQYDRELVIEVKRTDPAPQSTPAILLAKLAPLVGTFTWFSGPPSLQPRGYQRINEAVLAAPCLPDSSVVGGASLMAEFDLEPNAMYDFNIIAPRVGNGDDPLVVSGTRFTTSRYAGPNELMTDMGFALTGTAPYRPEDIILPPGASLPGNPMEVSDSLMDQLLRSMDADTLPLPSRKPVSYIVWRQDGANWLLEGILMDSLETLNREGAVRVGTGSEIVTRCKLSRAHILGNDFNVHRANENWTRVFLKPPGAFLLAAGRHDLTLEFQTSTGTISGKRTISHQPAIIEREGF